MKKPNAKRTDVGATVRTWSFTHKDALWLVPKLNYVLLSLGVSFLVAGTVAALGYDTLVGEVPSVLAGLKQAQEGDVTFWLKALSLGLIFVYHGGLPAFGAAVVAGFVGLKNWIYYGFIGLAIGIALPAFLLGADTIAKDEWPIFAVSGLAAGLTYWALAGRWLRFTSPPAPTKA